MSGQRFNMDDYVDVAERIAMFNERYPEGSLQSELEPSRNAAGELDGWFCRAFAYRTAQDERPGMGHAYEPVPGKTPYTRDSEAMNAETSAWGRAIIALGFPTKKIASANDVRNRQGDGNPDGTVRESVTPGPKALAPPKSWAKLTEMVSVYDVFTYEAFQAFSRAAARLLFPDEAEGKSVGDMKLEKADKDFLFQKCAGAALALREQFDPNELPYPTVDEIRACFARVLDGQELALEGEE